ncbi:HAMP domain-containing histidine kinase [Flavobacteriaceae bacterium]|nr:HAMP domain-containing histidine kinase [Flavobacteriaceae bacterium]
MKTSIKLTYARPILISIALAIVGLILWNTHNFLKEFKKEAQDKMSIWATAQSQFMGADPNAPLGDLVLEIFQSNTKTPMILSHTDGTYSFNNFNEDISENSKNLKILIERFAKENPPIKIKEGETVLATLYYGESPNIKNLRYFPLALLLILGLFSAVVYFALKLEKVAAQNILWASMAKETAHQIATPLSALMGWNSLLNERGVSPEITLEINKDLERLSTISNRFSSIGLETGLDKVALIQSTQEGIQYLSDRFPKSVDIQFQSKLEPHIIPLNKPLYFWCLENLIKNSIDAMKGHGIIIVEIAKNKKYIVVSVQDHGPGIEKKYLKKVTNPGFSTKKSGWGLGLSLTKRIVTQFHKGVLKIHSETNKGTRIEMHFPMA